MRVFLSTQLALALLLGSIVLLGRRSQPEVVVDSERIGVTDPIVLRFDRPVKRASLEGNFQLAAEEPVAGTFRWSARAVAFLPSTPLRHDTTYTLVLTDLEDELGRHLRQPLTRTIRTSPARFLYLTPARSLMLYLVEQRRTVSVSAAEERVLDFAVTPDGRTLFVSYFRDDGGSSVFGLYALTLDEQGPIDRPQEVRPEGTRRTFRLLLCDAGLTALVYENDFGPDAPVTNQRLLAVPVFGERLAFDQAQVILTGEAVAATVGFPASLACSPNSDRFLYGDSQRQVLLASLYDPASVVALGFPQQVYGFSPAELILLGQRASGASSSESTVLALDPQTGEQALLAAPGSDLFDPAFAADGSWLAVAEVRRGQGGGPTAATIGLYQVGAVPQPRQRLASAPPGEWDGQPAWSPDARYLAFVRQSRQGNAAPAFDGRGRSLDGRVLLAAIAEGGDGSRSASWSAELGIVGGQITWLP